MRLVPTIATVLLVLAGGPALAGVVDQTSTTDVFTGVAPDAPDYLVEGTIDDAGGASADGQLVFDLTSEFGGGLVQMVAHFGSSQTELQIAITTGSVSGAYLAGVNFEQTGGGTPSAFWFATLAGDGALASGALNLFTFDLSGIAAYSLTSQGGFASGSTYTQISLLFGFDAAGDRLQLDAVANGAVAVPLPPAAASGLGSFAALGVVALMRRRARRCGGSSLV